SRSRRCSSSRPSTRRAVPLPRTTRRRSPPLSRSAARGSRECKRGAGLYFEEFSEGQVFEHALTRTVTETDNVLFTTMTMNPQPLHLDAEFAAKTEFGRPLVNSLFTLGLVVGLAVPELTLGTTVANLGFSRIDFPAPVFPGDTIHVVTNVLEARRSRSRP